MDITSSELEYLIQNDYNNYLQHVPYIMYNILYNIQYYYMKHLIDVFKIRSTYQYIPVYIIIQYVH